MLAPKSYTLQIYTWMLSLAPLKKIGSNLFMQRIPIYILSDLLLPKVKDCRITSEFKLCTARIYVEAPLLLGLGPPEWSAEPPTTWASYTCRQPRPILCELQIQGANPKNVVGCNQNLQSKEYHIRSKKNWKQVGAITVILASKTAMCNSNCTCPFFSKVGPLNKLMQIV